MTDDLTKEQWLERLAPFDGWNERIMMATFAIWGIPPSMLDVGCGTGAMCNIARKLGVDAVGVDKIARPPDSVHDLRLPLNLGRTFQLVLCIEVAEHIPADNSGVFMNSVVSHVEREGRLVFSAAPPNQLGEGHVNTKPAEYWRSMIHERGLSYQDEMTAKLRLAWQWVPAPMMWLVGNVQVFER